MIDLLDCPICKNKPKISYDFGDYFVYCSDKCPSLRCYHAGDTITACSWNDWVEWFVRHNQEKPNKPLTLEELEQMDGEPVYAQCGDGHEGWYIVRTSEPLHANAPLAPIHAVWIVNDENPEGDNFDTDFLNMEYNDPAGNFGLHVLGWRVFRRKPQPKEAVSE